MLKKLTPFLLLACCTTAAHADDATALALAQQAGTIAGIAQACGQDVSLLNTRIAEAVRALGNTEPARNKAILIYTQTLNTAATEQQATQKVDCGQIKQDYQKLPILRNDYQDSVINQLKQVGQVTPEQTQAAKAAVAAPAGNTAAVPGAAVPLMSTTPSQTIPNVVGQPPSINPNSAVQAAPVAPTATLPSNTTPSTLDINKEAIQPTPPTPDVGNPFAPNPVTPAPTNPTQQAPNSNLVPQAGQQTTPGNS